MPYPRGIPHLDDQGNVIGRRTLVSSPDADTPGATGPRTPRTLDAGAKKLLEQPGWTVVGDTVAGPVTERVVDPATTDWPHRCTECGSRMHAGIDCPKVMT